MLKNELRALKAQLRADPSLIWVPAQIGLVTRRLHWFESRLNPAKTPSGRNAGTRSLNRGGRPRQRPRRSVDAPAA